MILFKSVKPGTPFKSSVFREEVKAEAAKIAAQAKKDFEKTVATWDDKPDFDVQVTTGRAAGSYITRTVAGVTSGVEIDVSTDDEIYGYVDEGTRPHIIRPKRKRKGLLAFKTGGRPKTKVKVIGSTAGKAGTKQAFAKEVHHPGTKARLFTKVIAKKWQPAFRKEMDAALRRAAKRSGHSTT